MRVGDYVTLTGEGYENLCAGDLLQRQAANALVNRFGVVDHVDLLYAKVHTKQNISYVIRQSYLKVLDKKTVLITQVEKTLLSE